MEDQTRHPGEMNLWMTWRSAGSKHPLQIAPPFLASSWKVTQNSKETIDEDTVHVLYPCEMHAESRLADGSHVFFWVTQLSLHLFFTFIHLLWIWYISFMMLLSKTTYNCAEQMRANGLSQGPSRAAWLYQYSNSQPSNQWSRGRTAEPPLAH